MIGWRWSGSGRLAARVFVGACAFFLPACGLILGLDEGVGVVQGDASEDAPSQDATRAPPGSAQPDGAEAVDDAPGPSDGGPAGTTSHPISPMPTDASSSTDGCTPSTSWCDTHCGNGPDNCGMPRQCPMNCPQGYGCNAQNVCACQSEPSWCSGRCGNTQDNCGNPIDCGVCAADAGQCVAEAVRQACGSRACGQATNNCNQLVNCGLLEGLCLLQVCLPDGGCCTPNSSAACGNHCGTSATDNCGQEVECRSTCGSGDVCYQKSCCTPTDPCSGACGVTRVDNCGQTVRCGCSGAGECVTRTSTCCTPQGCSANCVDSCGLPSNSCCIEAGPPDASNSDAEPMDANLAEPE